MGAADFGSGVAERVAFADEAFACPPDQYEGNRMTRPRRGLPFEDAGRLWGDKARLDDLNKLEARRQPGASWKSSYERAQQALYRSLIGKLYERIIFVSAIRRDGATRSMINPELLNPSTCRYWPNDRGLSFTREHSPVYEPEVFELHSIPLNVLSKPNWFSLIEKQEMAGFTPDHGPVQSSYKEFRHTPDYRHVILRGVEYALTEYQARVVEVLHQAYIEDRDSWVHLKVLRSRVDFESEKLSQLFRRLPNWRDLIRSDRRGYYRLNL